MTTKNNSLLLAWKDIVICAIVLITMLVVGIRVNAYGFLFALVALAMEARFVRVLHNVRIARRTAVAPERTPAAE